MEDFLVPQHHPAAVEHVGCVQVERVAEERGLAKEFKFRPDVGDAPEKATKLLSVRPHRPPNLCCCPFLKWQPQNTPIIHFHVV